MLERESSGPLLLSWPSADPPPETRDVSSESVFDEKDATG